MREKLIRWMYADNTPIPFADIDRPLLSRLRTLGLLGICILLGFLILAILFDAFMLLPMALIVALYLGWECVSLYRAVQLREVQAMLCCITEIKQTAWDKYKNSQALVLLNEEDKEFVAPLSYGSKTSDKFAVEDFVTVYYNKNDGIMEYDTPMRFRTIYAISPATPPEAE